MKILITALFLALASSSVSATESFSVYLTRHYDKQANVKNPSLTDVGVARALKLSEYLSPITINSVFSTDYPRTRETAGPVAVAKDVIVELYDPRNPQVLVESVLEQSQAVLIVGHSNTIPDLVRRLGGEADAIDESEYGTLYIVTIDGAKRTTREVQIEP